MADQDETKKKSKTRTYDSEDSRRRLRKAALDLFSREGYEATSTKAIAIKAKVNEALIQRYFKGKSGLLFSIVEESHAQSEEIEMPPLSGTIEEEINIHFDYARTRVRSKKKFLKLVMGRLIVDEEFRKEMARFAESKHTEQIERFADLQKKNVVRADYPAEDLFEFLHSVIMGWVIFLDVIESFDEARFVKFSEVSKKLLADALRPRK